MPTNKTDYNRAYRQKNLDKRKAQDRAYYQANKERLKEKQRDYHAAHLDKERNRSREYYRRHIEQSREYGKRYRATHKDAIRARQASWRKRHIERLRIKQKAWRNSRIEQTRHLSRLQAARRRNRKLSAEGSHSAADIQGLLQAQNNFCWWCGELLVNGYEVDHRIPLSRGGSDGVENLVIACVSCNRRKSNKLPSEWNGRLL